MVVTLPEIAAEARRMAELYRSAPSVFSPSMRMAMSAAADFDRLAEMAEGRLKVVDGATRVRTGSNADGPYKP